jgi:uncharacterized protein (DUF305 family)
MTGVEQARVDSIRRPYTAADIAFMSGMIAHHAQAVKMAGWAASHGAEGRSKSSAAESRSGKRPRSV